MAHIQKASLESIVNQYLNIVNSVKIYDRTYSGTLPADYNKYWFKNVSFSDTDKIPYMITIKNLQECINFVENGFSYNCNCTTNSNCCQSCQTQCSSATGCQSCQFISCQSNTCQSQDCQTTKCQSPSTTQQCQSCESGPSCQAMSCQKCQVCQKISCQMVSCETCQTCQECQSCEECEACEGCQSCQGCQINSCQTCQKDI